MTRPQLVELCDCEGNTGKNDGIVGAARWPATNCGEIVGCIG